MEDETPAIVVDNGSGIVFILLYSLVKINGNFISTVFCHLNLNSIFWMFFVLNTYVYAINLLLELAVDNTHFS